MSTDTFTLPDRGARTARWAEESFWREFWSGFHIFDVEYLKTQQAFQVDDATGNALNALLKQEGYFEVRPGQWDMAIEQLAALVTRLDEAGIPLPFSYVYDEFWSLFLRVNKIIEKVLGPGFLRLPDFWTWRVDPRRSESGWSPHRDKNYLSLFEDRSPKSMTIWIPLTQSTPLNGCMYVVPADRDPTYGTPEDKEWKFAYADVRALPAAPGTIFGWTQAVLHWGSHACERESMPRISTAFEYQSARVPPMNQPLTSPYEIPNFSFRLQLIAKQILQYRHMYPLAADVEAWAQDVLASSAG